MANPNPETTPMTHSVVAYWDDMASDTTTWMGRVIYPSKRLALAAVTSEARLAGAPGRARVVEEFDISFMIDRIVVQWTTPVWSEQPKDIYGIDPRFKGDGQLKPRIKLNRRLGDIPQ